MTGADDDPASVGADTNGATTQAPDLGADTSADPGMRILRRLWAIGTVVASLLALLVGAVGGTGRDGFAVFTLVLALTAVVTGLVGTVGLVRDDLTDRRVSRRRIAVVVGSFFGSALLMAMVTGVGG